MNTSPGDSSDPENEYRRDESSSYNEQTLTNGHEANQQIPVRYGEIPDQSSHFDRPAIGSYIDYTLRPTNEVVDLNLNESYKDQASRSLSLPPTVEMPTAESRKSTQESSMDIS